MGKSLVFRELQLEGFGPYEKKTRFLFNGGVNTYLAENETGKSTMALGILAVLFGLPHSISQDGFCFPRFKNVKGDRHEGELLFEVNRKIYGVQRNFETHEMILWKVSKNKEKEILLEGSHNPRSSKPFKAYEEFLEKTMGIGDQSVFEHTFFVGQPLPETTEITGNLQALMIGNQGSSLSGLLDQLVNPLKRVTKYTGPNDLGITPSNMRKDGELEENVRCYEELKASYEKSKETSEQLVDVQIALNDLEKKLMEHNSKWSEKKNISEALKVWEDLKREYERVSIERNRLKKLMEKIHTKNIEKVALQKKMKEEFFEFQGANKVMEEDLRKLINAIEKKEEYMENIEKEKDNMKSILTKKEEVENLLKDFAGWGKMGYDPEEKLETLEKNLNRIILIWEEMKAKEDRLEGLEELLVNQYSIFEKADEEILELIENDQKKRIIGERELERALSALKEEEEKFALIVEMKEEIRRHYGHLLDFPEEGINAVNDKIILLQREKELKSKILQRKDKNSNNHLLIPLGGFIIGGLGLLIFSTIGGILGFGVGFLLGILIKIGLEAWSKPLKKLKREVTELREKMDYLDRFLGPFSKNDAIELTRLSESLIQKRRLEEKAEEKAKDLDEIKIQNLRERVEQEKRKLNTIEEQRHAFKEVYEDPQKALRIWKKHRETMGIIKQDLREFYERYFDVGKNDLEPFSFNKVVKDREWKDIFEVLSTIDQEKNFSKEMSVEDFFNTASHIDAIWWKDLKEKGRSYKEILEEDKFLNHQINSLDENIVLEKKKLKNLQEKIDKMEDKWKDCLECNEKDPQKTLRRYLESLEKQRGLIQLDNDIQNLLEGEGKKDIAELEQLVSLREDESRVSLSKWKEHIRKHPKLPDVSEDYDRVAMVDAKNRLEQEIDDLEISIEELEVLKLELRSKQAFLEGSEPINIAATELELKELQKNRVDLEIRRDALAIAYREMEEAIKDYRKTYQENLEMRATDYYKKITGNYERSIVFNDNMEVIVKEGGRMIALQSLSKGSKDQMFLSLRFAIADVISEELKIPFFFDDPFVGTDIQRLERIKEVVEKQKNLRQIFILSHQSQYSEWGQEIEIFKSVD